MLRRVVQLISVLKAAVPEIGQGAGRSREWNEHISPGPRIELVVHHRVPKFDVGLPILVGWDRSHTLLHCWCWR